MKQGTPVPPDLPEVAAALRPLLAFQGEMQRQGKEKLFFGVKDVFTTQLESWLNKTR
jgi:hypothetical protein